MINILQSVCKGNHFSCEEAIAYVNPRGNQQSTFFSPLEEAITYVNRHGDD